MHRLALAYIHPEKKWWKKEFEQYSKSTILPLDRQIQEDMIVAVERPRSPLTVTKREYKELLDRLAPTSHTRVRCCATQLISYFEHWHEWKEAHYPTRWIYQPLTEIRHDLMDAFTVHVVREAIALLQSLGFLSVRKNDRTTNHRNGQDRTHQYLLDSDHIKQALENPSSQSAAETLATTPFVNVEIPSVNVEIPNFTVETYTQIPYSDSCPNSYSLLQEREELKSQPRKGDVKISQNKSNEIKEVIEQDKEPLEDRKAQESCNNINPDVEQCSVAPVVKCVEPTQDDLKSLPKLKSDRVPLVPSAERASGFVSNEERQGFYQVLLELGKTKGVRSPVAWSAAIIKSIDKGEPCQYLTEYRSCLLVGACEKQEWEIAPGQPYEQFVTYLKTKNKKTGMTDEEAIAAAHHFLKDVNLAKSLWESCKRAIAKYQEDWEQQKRIGVQNAYLPPELLPERHVSLEEVADAMESLQTGCGQLQGLAESTENSTLLSTEPEEAEAELEPTKELLSEPATELGSVGESEPEEKPTMAQLQDKLNSPLGAALTRMMVKANPSWGYRIEDDLVLPVEGAPSLEHLQSLLDNKITDQRVQRLINQNPDWGFLIDEKNQLWDF